MRQVESGAPVKGLRRKHGFSEASCHYRNIMVMDTMLSERHASNLVQRFRDSFRKQALPGGLDHPLSEQTTEIAHTFRHASYCMCSARLSLPSITNSSIGLQLAELTVGRTVKAGR